MNTKILLFSIVGSLLIHGVVLGLAGTISMRQSVPEEKIITLYINEIAPEEQEEEEIAVPEPEKAPPQETSSAKNTQTAQKTQGMQSAPQGPPPSVGQKEDTVDLSDPSDNRYRPYLLQVRKRIEQNWAYPESPIARQMEGTTVILFSIVADGSLSDAVVSSSSGSNTLDQGSLAAIRSATPFEPLPASYGLNKLNIYASFSYRLGN